MAPRTFVCSVHTARQPRWAAIQSGFVRRFISDAQLVGAFDQASQAANGYDRVEILDGPFNDKLDRLAALIVSEMSQDDEDILIFLDGDAFPIRNLGPFIAEALARSPLAAIQRLELRESFPHPAFCVTTTGFWKDIHGTWDYAARPTSLAVNDMGCRLLELLQDAGAEWLPLVRSNTFNPHPVLFGVYGGLVYHHGAGFRQPVTAQDRAWWRSRAPAGTWTSVDRYRFWFDAIGERNALLSELVRQMIEAWPDFYTLFQNPELANSSS